jgi:hypothetical protein
MFRQLGPGFITGEGDEGLIEISTLPAYGKNLPFQLKQSISCSTVFVRELWNIPHVDSAANPDAFFSDDLKRGMNEFTHGNK